MSNFSVVSATCFTDMYTKEHNDESIASLTLTPFRNDKSVINCHFPG